MLAKYLACFLSVFGALTALAAQPQSPEVKDVLDRLDKAAKIFQTMSAKIERKDYTAVLHEMSTQNGTVAMKKLSSHGVQGIMDITAPDKVTYSFNGSKIVKYVPAMKTADEYDVGEKGGEQLESFLMLGFGTSGAELLNSFQVKLGGTDTVNEQSTMRLELAPKTAEAKKYMKEVDLWIPQGGNYPIQEKLIQPSGDYTLVTYSEVKINDPKLKDEDLKLKLPKGVKPGKPR